MKRRRKEEDARDVWERKACAFYTLQGKPTNTTKLVADTFFGGTWRQVRSVKIIGNPHHGTVIRAGMPYIPLHKKVYFKKMQKHSKCICTVRSVSTSEDWFGVCVCQRARGYLLFPQSVCNFPLKQTMTKKRGKKICNPSSDERVSIKRELLWP